MLTAKALAVHAPLLAIVTVRTPSELKALALQTYILGAVVAAVYLAVAAIIANVIKFEGGARPRDPGKRRLWFWLLFALAIVSFFVYNLVAVTPIVAANLQGRFFTANAIGVGITAAFYAGAGFVLSKVFSTGKLGNWFGSSR